MRADKCFLEQPELRLIIETAQATTEEEHLTQKGEASCVLLPGSPIRFWITDTNPNANSTCESFEL